MASVINGVLVHPKVYNKTFAKIEKGPLKTVHAIIVHQTDAENADQTFNSYKKGGAGAHFLIEKSGTIYQTARVTQKTYHVGKIKSRCYEAHVCTLAETENIKSMLFQKGKSYRDRVTNLHKHEAAKPFPERFPTNEDSIGIELVGKFDQKTGKYETVTDAQNASLRWLIKELATALKLETVEVHSHPAVSYKPPSEAETAILGD
jgi:N-acetyl-anhydromuramyl-L-alanine amidase AmpD